MYKKIYQYIIKLINSFISLIYPYKCPICNKIILDKDTFCSDCWKKVKFIHKPFCNKCSAPFEFQVGEDDICLNCINNKPLYIKLRSAVIYNKTISKLIFKFKFYDLTCLRYIMAKYMINASYDIINDVDVLIPVPLHKRRLIYRKYNQSLLLANEIANKTDKIVINDFLIKIAHTTPQVKLRKKDRQNNLKNKFIVNPKYLNNIDKYKSYNFAIVDDVITTGSTINECVKAFNNVDIYNVYVMTFAKTFLS